MWSVGVSFGSVEVPFASVVKRLDAVVRPFRHRSAPAGDSNAVGRLPILFLGSFGGGPGQLHLYRLFGDVNDDGVVDATDVGQLKFAFNSGRGSPFYLSYLDADNSGSVDAQDIGQFKSRFNVNVF